MPVVKHVLNFSELISKAAHERRRLHTKKISYSQRIYTNLQSFDDDMEGKEKEKEKQSSDSSINDFPMPISLIERKLLFISISLDQFLHSSLMKILRAVFYFIAFTIIAFETEKSLSDKSIVRLTVFNYIIDAFFCIEASCKLCIFLTGWKHPGATLALPSIVLIDGLIELGTTLGSLTCAFSENGAWFRLARVFYLSIHAVKHTAHLDVLMVISLQFF